MKYYHSYLFILPLMLLDTCDNPPAPPKCPLTNMAVSKEMAERIREEYDLPDHSLRLEKDEEGELYILLELDGKSYEINRDIQKYSTVDYRDGVNRQLTLLRDNACHEISQIEMDQSLVRAEKRRQMRVVRNNYLDRCMAIIEKEASTSIDAEPGQGPPLEVPKVEPCHPSVVKYISPEQLQVKLPWLPEGTSILLHFEPRDPLLAHQSQHNYGIQRSVWLDRQSSLSLSRSALSEGLKERNLLVSIYDDSNNKESLMCRFYWMR